MCGHIGGKEEKMERLGEGRTSVGRRGVGKGRQVDKSVGTSPWSSVPSVHRQVRENSLKSRLGKIAVDVMVPSS